MCSPFKKICYGFLLMIVAVGFLGFKNNSAKAYSLKDKTYLAAAQSERESEGNEGNDSVKTPAPSISQMENIPANQQESAQSDASFFPWYTARAAGIVAYVIMFLIIVLGEGMTSGAAYNFMSPVKAWVAHKYLGIAFGVMMILHMVALLFDKFINFSILDVLVPFFSSYQSFFLSLGIISFYIVVGVLLSSLLIRLRFPALWRNVHYLVYPLFVFSFFHGVFLGTDTKTLAMQLLYAFTAAVFLLLLWHRWRFHRSRV